MIVIRHVMYNDVFYCDDLSAATVARLDAHPPRPWPLAARKLVKPVRAHLDNRLPIPGCREYRLCVTGNYLHCINNL